MPFYRMIKPSQEPADLGLDEQNRPKWGFNIETEKRASDTFAAEISKRLVDQGVIAATSIFTSSKAQVPTGAGPFIVIIETGGFSPEDTHDRVPPGHQKPSAQISARSTSAAVARTTARAAYNALVTVRNINLSA